MRSEFQADVEAVSSIQPIPSILEIICRTTGMGFATVARVTEQRWVALAVRDEIQFGLVPGGELELETTICHEIRQHQQAVVIPNVAEDKDYSCHHTPIKYGLQSYIAVPIQLKTGKFFGTLCAIDPRPADIGKSEVVGMFRLFAELIAFHLEGIEQIALAEARLQEERKLSELREQFIAVLGHDLRNPVGAVANVAQILLTLPLGDEELALTNIIKDSSFRMKGLIENILDFARGRLGDGIILNRDKNEKLEALLQQVITEVKYNWPDGIIETHFALEEPVNCDGKRLAQLFANLLANAMKYGKKNIPVKVSATSRGGEFLLTVTNKGDKIPDTIQQRLFLPFTRGESQQDQQGLGLGLYIATQIAQAHGGTLSVDSTEEETNFTLRMPNWL